MNWTPSPRNLSDRTELAIREVVGGRRARPRSGAAVRRAGGDLVDRLHGSGQLRHQHPGGREVRLRAAVGRVAGEPHRHVVPGAVGQARHRHRPQPGGDVARPIPAADCRRAVDRRRDRRHCNRPRGIRRRRDRLVAAVQHSAVRRHGRDGDRDLWRFAVRGGRLPPGRTGHRRIGGGDQPLLSRRDVHHAGRLGFGGSAFGYAADSRRRGADDRRRHHWRDRDAARDLSPFRPHPEPRRGARRRRAAHVVALLQSSKSWLRLRSPAWSIWR